MEAQRVEFAQFEASPDMQANNRSIRHSVHEGARHRQEMKHKFELKNQSRGLKNAFTLQHQGRGSTNARHEGASVGPSVRQHELDQINSCKVNMSAVQTKSQSDLSASSFIKNYTKVTADNRQSQSPTGPEQHFVNFNSNYNTDVQDLMMCKKRVHQKIKIVQNSFVDFKRSQ